MCRLDSIRSATGLLTSSVFPFTTTFSPRRWSRCVRAAWWPSSHPATPWTPRTAPQGSISPSARTSSARSACPTMPSKPTPVRMSSRILSFFKSGTDPLRSNPIGYTRVSGETRERTRTAFPSISISSTTRRWCWGGRPRKARSTAGRTLPLRPSRAQTLRSSSAAQFGISVEPMRKRSCPIWARMRPSWRPSRQTRMCGTSPTPWWTGSCTTGRTAS